MRAPRRPCLGRFSLATMVCAASMFCVATSITSRAQTLTTLYSFCSQPGCTDGSGPIGLLQATDGNFYGTTSRGGTNGDGTVFKINLAGTLATLYSFCVQQNCSDGEFPTAGLVEGADGNFYGTTSEGGAGGGNCTSFGCGTVFEITPGGTLTTLHSFDAYDGAYPNGLVQGADGNFYGTTYGGGPAGVNSYGTAFKITPGGMLTTLHNFCSQQNCNDGAIPEAGLVQGTDGNFYGTTTRDGAGGNGTVFKMTPSGTLTTLHPFNGTDGSAPAGALVQGTDGNFYGTTYKNGANGGGTVFKISPEYPYTLTTLYSFCAQNGCADGENSQSGLVQGTDGNFYGTTYYGGANGYGTVFNITPAGKLRTLHSFALYDGAYPYAGLVQGTDGNFYGTTYIGGAKHDGTVFRLAPVQLIPVTPCRVVDTRNSNGTFGGPPIQGGHYRSFPIPQGNCNIPSIAGAYSLNVTVVPHESLGYLTIWPAGQSQPGVSLMNSLDGRIKANAAIVGAGENSAVSVYATNTTDVILDIDGYFASSSGSTLQFYPLTPCRVLDTRNPDGPLGGPFLMSGQERDFPVLSSNCSIPSSAQAYSMNFTVVPYNGEMLGYLTVWPEGSQKPVVSTLNNLTATIVANAAIVPAGTGGGIAAYPSGNTQLVADIDGYFALAGSGGLSLYALTPCRALDTRKAGGAFSGELTVDVVDSVCAPPSTAQAYVFNATVVPTGSLGYLTLWPDSEQQPGVSTLNAIDGAVTSNMAIVPNINGKTDVFADGITQLILDISGYFAP